MVNLVPPNGRPNGPQILPADKICRDTQLTPNVTEGSPRLVTTSGSMITLLYQENGHVTLPETPAGKPANRGTIYIYGTADSRPDDTLLAIHKIWNLAGDGGDRRGRLVATQNFDDGRCYQINSGTISKQRQVQFSHVPDKIMSADLWCQNKIIIPQDAPVDRLYTLYWVWDWPTIAGTSGLPNGKAEIYTTCIDVSLCRGAFRLLEEGKL